KSIDRQFGADIQILTPGFMAVGSLGPSFEHALRNEPGVAAITSLRFAQVKIVGVPSSKEDGVARIIDPATYSAMQSCSFFHRNHDDATAALLAGGAILVPADSLTTYKKKIGDSLEIGTSQGPKPFRIVATYASLGGPPEFVFGLPDGKRFFNAGNANA